ncbi:MAG: hypothetical protein HKN68_13740 [Saprospiraceae bacterium]|nr:hypothetical protein [Saprospiraceae bacterium]
MLRLFRNIRRTVSDSDPLRKYLFYAIGEIFLVVVGILLALQINNWNQDRINKNTEKKLLEELVENLSVNAQRLEESVKGELKTASSIEIVVDVLENKKPHHDSLNYHFGRADFAADVVLTNTAFQAISSRGFEIIRSDDLRKAIIDLFDTEYGFLIAMTIRLEDQFWPSSALPLFHKHFRIKNMNKHNLKNGDFDAIPVDYNALLRDDEYHNMIKHRGAFRYEGAKIKREVLNKTRLLINLLEEYLSTF